MRGQIRSDQTKYQTNQPITVGYWLTNVSEQVFQEEKVADGSQDAHIPFQSYYFNAASPDNKEQHLILEKAGKPFEGSLRLGSGEKQLFVTNIFKADHPGPYLLTFHMRWCNNKEIEFQPITIAIQAPPVISETADVELEKALGQLKFQDEKVRREAWGKIPQLGSKAIPKIVELLGDQNVALRAEAMQYLIDLQEEAIPSLLSHIAHNNREVRLRVVYILGEIGTIQSVIPLKDAAVKDPDKNIRVTALKAISSSFTEVIAIPVLILSLRDSEQEIRTLAIDELKKVTNSDLGFVVDAPLADREKAIEKWKDWWQAKKLDSSK